MNATKIIIAGLCCLLMILSTAASAQKERRSIAVVLETPKQHIPDFNLVDRLNDVLAMYAETKVIIPDEDSTLPGVPDSRFNIDRLVNWGREAGARYIIYIQIDDRRIDRTKKWSIPLIFSRYVVEGRIEGAYSLIDTRHQKLVDTWNLEATLEGPKQIQPFDDYRGDPDLHISAPGKMAFLRKLEDLAAAQIIKNVAPNLRGR